MKVDRQIVGTVEVLAPHGALVDRDAEEFSKLLAEVTAKPNPRIVVSMDAVAYMDSDAIEGFLDALDNVDAAASGLKICGLTPACREILELTDASARFSIFESVSDAVRSYL